MPRVDERDHESECNQSVASPQLHVLASYRADQTDRFGHGGCLSRWAGRLGVTEAVTRNPIRFMGAGFPVSVRSCVGFGTSQRRCGRGWRPSLGSAA
ncbi:hypothetical protein GCM10027590_50370 [Nocardiopsis nanhaiensis]